MSILNFAALSGGKNQVRNLLTSSSQDVMESGSSVLSQCFALSFKENGNNRRQMASSLTSLSFTVSHTSKKFRMSALGFSWGSPVLLVGVGG